MPVFTPAPPFMYLRITFPTFARLPSCEPIMNTSLLRRLFFALAIPALLLSAGCSSCPSTNGDPTVSEPKNEQEADQPQEQTPGQLPMPEETRLVLTVVPDEASSFLASMRGGVEVDEDPVDAMAVLLAALLDGQAPGSTLRSRPSLDTEQLGLDGSRPVVVAISTRGNGEHLRHLTNAVPPIGPDSLFRGFSWRLFVPTDTPSTVVDAIDAGELGNSSMIQRTEDLDGYLVVDAHHDLHKAQADHMGFELPSIDYAADEDYFRRQTPAAETFLAEPTALSVYLRGDDLPVWAALLASNDAHTALEMATVDQRQELLTQSMLTAAQLLQMAGDDVREYEDFAFGLHGDDADSLTIQLVQTHTALGEELAGSDDALLTLDSQFNLKWTSPTVDDARGIDAPQWMVELGDEPDSLQMLAETFRSSGRWAHVIPKALYPRAFDRGIDHLPLLGNLGISTDETLVNLSQLDAFVPADNLQLESRTAEGYSTTYLFTGDEPSGLSLNDDQHFQLQDPPTPTSSCLRRMQHLSATLLEQMGDFGTDPAQSLDEILTGCENDAADIADEELQQARWIAGRWAFTLANQALLKGDNDEALEHLTNACSLDYALACDYRDDVAQLGGPDDFPRVEQARFFVDELDRAVPLLSPEGYFSVSSTIYRPSFLDHHGADDLASWTGSSDARLHFPMLARTMPAALVDGPGDRRHLAYLLTADPDAPAAWLAELTAAVDSLPIDAAHRRAGRGDAEVDLSQKFAAIVVDAPGSDADDGRPVILTLPAGATGDGGQRFGITFNGSMDEMTVARRTMNIDEALAFADEHGHPGRQWGFEVTLDGDVTAQQIADLYSALDRWHADRHTTPLRFVINRQ